MSKLVLLVVFVAAGAPALAAKRLGPKGGESLRVSYVLHDRVFVPAGARRGVEVGATGKLPQRRGPGLTCRVAAVADTSCVCVLATPGAPVDAGDPITLDLEPEVELVARPEQARPLVASATVTAAQRRLASATFTRVASRTRRPDSAPRPARPGRRAAGAVSLSHLAAWSATQRQRRFDGDALDVWLAGSLGDDSAWSVRSRFGAVRWWRRPDPHRFRVNESTQLDVGQLSIARRDSRGGLVTELGRFTSPDLPGVPTFDGGQVGYAGDRTQVGVFGGVLPNYQTTALEAEPWIAGAYAGVVHSAADSHVVQTRLHAGGVGRGNKRRVILGTNTAARVGSEWFLDAQLASSAPQQAVGRVGLDHGGLQVRFLPNQDLHVGVGVLAGSGFSWALPDPRGLRDSSLRRVDGEVGKRLSDNFELVVHGAGARSAADARSRAQLGVVARLGGTWPLFLRPEVGVAEELGDHAAHTAHVACSLSPTDSWSLSIASYGALGADLAQPWFDSSTHVAVTGTMAEHVDLRVLVGTMIGAPWLAEVEGGFTAEVTLIGRL